MQDSRPPWGYNKGKVPSQSGGNRCEEHELQQACVPPAKVIVCRSAPCLAARVGHAAQKVAGQAKRASGYLQHRCLSYSSAWCRGSVALQVLLESRHINMSRVALAEAFLLLVMFAFSVDWCASSAGLPGRGQHPGVVGGGGCSSKHSWARCFFYRSFGDDRVALALCSARPCICGVRQRGALFRRGSLCDDVRLMRLGASRRQTTACSLPTAP